MRNFSDLPPGCTPADIERAFEGEGEPDLVAELIELAAEALTLAVEVMKRGVWDEAEVQRRLRRLDCPHLQEWFEL